MYYLPLLLILAVVIYWIVQIFQGNLPLIDHLIEQGLRDIVSVEPIFIFARIVTELGSKTFLVPFVFIMMFVFFILYRTVIPSIIFAGGTLFTHGVNMLIKDIVQRERPLIWLEAGGYGYSFPSGHAMISLVCYGLLTYYLSLKVKHSQYRRLLHLCFSLLILLIGLSRFVLNVHYLTDIISGFLFGYFLLLFFLFIDRKWNESYF